MQDAVELADQDAEDTDLGLVDDRLAPPGHGGRRDGDLETLDCEELAAAVPDDPGVGVVDPAVDRVEGRALHGHEGVLGDLAEPSLRLGGDDSGEHRVGNSQRGADSMRAIMRVLVHGRSPSHQMDGRDVKDPLTACRPECGLPGDDFLGVVPCEEHREVRIGRRERVRRLHRDVRSGAQLPLLRRCRVVDRGDQVRADATDSDIAMRLATRAMCRPRHRCIP